MRIVSLLPSGTEMLCGLGLIDSLVGVTDECDHPSEVKRLPKVTEAILQASTSSEIDQSVRQSLESGGALYRLNAELLHKLQPNLIVTQALCEVCAISDREVQSIARELDSKPALINLEPSSLGDVFECIRRLGVATDRTREASGFVQELQSRVKRVEIRSRLADSCPSVVLLEWVDPPFSSGHWNPELIRIAGGREVLGVEGQPSQTLDWAAVRESDPEVIVIACCGFDVYRARQDLPILESYEGWDQLRCFRNHRVHWVEGPAYFNRPGPRLVDSLEILANLIHPNLHPVPELL
ncbi:MAG: cobalamin-binding protein [Planctomycetota bacterium]